MSADPDPTLDAQALLQRAEPVRLTLGAHGAVKVQTADGEVEAGTRGLALLEVFASPRTIGSALDALGTAGREDWIDTMSAVLRLVRAGALVRPGEACVGEATRAFGAPGIHAAMLDDRPRTRGYLDAVAAVVRPGDVVVDIGTGTGILAVAAARAGARRVYAVELNPRIAQVAREVFAANGVADRIQLVEGLSTEVELPERASVLISETLGDKAFNEGILGTLADARKRLLTPDARLIPAEIRVVAIPVDVPDAKLREAMIIPAAQADWRTWYGLDLSPLARLRPNPRWPFLSDVPTGSAAWPRLAGPLELACIETASLESDFLQSSTTFEISRAGTLSGVTLAFDVGLAHTIRLDNVPGRAGAECHWHAPTWPVQPPLPVEPGDVLVLHLEAGSDGLFPTLSSEATDR